VAEEEELETSQAQAEAQTQAGTDTAGGNAGQTHAGNLEVQGSVGAMFPGSDLRHAPRDPTIPFPPPYAPPAYLGDDPDEMAAVAAAGMSSHPVRKAGDWRLIPAKTDEGKPFYYNKATKEKQWDRPSAFAEEEARVLEEARQTAADEARRRVMQ